MRERPKRLFSQSPLNPAGFFSFKKYPLKKLFMKSVASALIFSFSYSQLVWAVDVRQMLLDAKASFEEQDTRRSSGVSASSLSSAQTQAQSVVSQQQALQELQNANFNLTTANGDILQYVGNTLSGVQRPDGTELNNIQTDINGSIISADLKLSDGSIQIFQNGQVIGYGTPDGGTVIYQNGQVQKVTSKTGIETLYTYNRDTNGNLIETVLDNSSYTTKYDTNNKLKEVYEKATGSRTSYANGIIQKTVKSDGSQILYNSAVQANGDILVTPVGSSGANTFTDAQGNIFYFTAGNVSSVKLKDGSTLDNITWDTSNLVKDANLTAIDGSKYIYQNKQLMRSTDPTGVVTNYTYTATNIVITSAGNTWTYDLNKNPLSFTDLLGNTTTYLTTGAFKGLKDRDILSTGQTFIYEYTSANSVISVQKREVHLQVYNYTTLDGQTTIAAASNPNLFINTRFENDNSFDPQINITANGTGKSLAIKLVAGSVGSSYTFNGVTTALNVTMNKGTAYTVELRWETGRVGIYVYPQGATRPSTPQGTISDRSWDAKFKVVGQNAYVTNPWDSTYNYTTRGTFNTNFSTNSQGFVYLPGTPAERINFNPSGSYRDITLKVKQSLGSIYRTITLYWYNNSWSTGVSDWNSSTNVTTSTNSSVAQTLNTGTDYVADLRIEGTKLNVYAYLKGTDRPLTPTISLNSLTTAAEFEATFSNATGKAEEYKNLTAPVYSSSFQAVPISAKVDTVKNLTIVKPSAVGTVNPMDYLSITYGSDSKIKQIIKTDNTKYIFQNGLLSQVLDASGNPTNFNFTQSLFSNITGSEITQNGLNSTYDAAGKLSSVKLNDLTIHYGPTSLTTGATPAIDFIEKTDGTRLRNLVFDASGNVTGADITAPSGEVRSYQNGQLVNLRQSDNSQIFYANAKPLKFVTPENITYNFDYTSPGIVQAVIDPLVVTPNALTPVKMQYDTNFNLTKVIRQNQQVLNYLNNSLTQIDIPLGASQVFNYQKDANGNVLSYTVTQGNVVTAYDAQNNPTSAVISPTTDNPHTLNVSYQYGKIRQIKKEGVATFNYTYAFDASNNEITQIDDLEENTFKTYQNGNMSSSLDKNTSVLSSYSYTNGKVSQVQVSRFGRNLHTYQYSYEGNNAIVVDEENVIRTYDQNKKLLYLEKEGQKFKYAYVTTIVPSTPVTQQTVLAVNTLNTSSRSTGPNAWQQWIANTTEGSLGIGSPGWVTYNASLSQAGDLKIEFDSTNFNGSAPSTYQFNLNISVDGVVKNTYSTTAANTWKSNSLTLTGLSQGAHTITITWTNDYYVAGQYDANFKFRNLKMTHLFQAPTQAPEEIVQEELVERKLSDGSVAHYTAGKLTNITRPDGSVILDLVTDANGQVTQATLTLTGGIKKIFNNTAILEEIDPDGTHFYFQNNKISKVTDPSGKDLVYSYDQDAQGNIQTVWIKTAGANLKYSINGNLLGLKLDGFLTPAEVSAQTVHVYQGSGVGPNSIDGDFNTWQYDSLWQLSGSTGKVVSEHDFPQAQIINSVTFDMYAYARAGSNFQESSRGTFQAGYYVEVLRNGQWEQVQGSYVGRQENNVRTGSVTFDSGVVTLSNLNLTNVSAIRAYAYGSGNFLVSNGFGTTISNDSAAAAGIYEIKWTLADQANLNFSRSVNTQGQTTGYSFQGYPGTINFDAQGNLLAGTPANLNSTAQGLAGKAGFFDQMPYKANLIVPSTPSPSSWISLAQSSFLDPQAIISQEYSADGTLETQTKTDGTVTLFENNKPSEVLDSKGDILIQYSYDTQGNPTRVYLKNARDTLPDEVLKARQSIEQQRAQNLLTLVSQKNLAYQSIQTQFANQRISLQQSLNDLQNQYNQVANTSASGKKAKNARGDVLNQIGVQMSQASVALTASYQQEADAYAALDTQVKAVSDKIEADSQSAFTQLSTQEANMKQEILRQEASPIVYDYYRRLLGRDPSNTEYNSWIAKIDYASGNTFTETKITGGQTLGAALATTINSSQELIDRQTYVQNVKNSVTAAINNYIAMTPANQQSFASSLGLTVQDLIPFSSADAQKISTWLNSRSLHFGQSAFLSLESLLDQKSIVYDRQDLAKKCILVDVFSGVITPLDDGDLVISMFSLNKVASLYGVSLQGANLTWNDLMADIRIFVSTMVPAGTGGIFPRFIALINTSHYVVITAMSRNSVTYLDTGSGADKNNDSVTISKEEFLKIWKGNALVSPQTVTMAQVTPGSQVRLLSTQELQKLRGACLFLLIPIFAVVTSVASAVGTVIAGVAGIIAGIGTFVGSVIANIGAALGGILKGIGDVLYFGIKFAASTILNAGQQIFASFAQQSVIGGATQASFGNALFQTAVKTGISIATTKGLEALGVNPTIANLASAFVTGGISGGFNAGFTASNLIVGGIKGLALSGSQTLLQKVGLDANLASTLSLITSPLIDGIQQGNVGAQLVKIIPNLTKDLTLYGVDKLGASLGLDPRVSTLIGAPVSAGLGAGLQGGVNVGQNIITAINQGLTQGVVSYGLNFIGNSNPILGSLLSPDVAKNIELAIGRDGLFQGIFNILRNTALNAFNVIGGVVQTFTQGITDFGALIQQKGLVGALQSFVGSIFSRSGQESILGQGGIQNIFNTIPKVSTTLPSGKSAQEIKINGNNSIYLDASGNLLGFKKDGAITEGSYGMKDGNFGLNLGQLAASVGDLVLSSSVKDGQATQILIKDSNGNVILEGDPENQNTPIRIEGPSTSGTTQSFDFWGAVFKVVPFGLSLFLNQGIAYGAQVTNSAPSQPVSTNSTTLFALVNGILNKEMDPNKSPDYINNFESDIAGSSNGQYVAGRDFMKSAIYQGLLMSLIPPINNIENQVKDVLSLFFEAVSPIVHLASSIKIMMDFESRFRAIPSDKTRPMVAMGYSGGFMPLIEAIQQKHYNTDTLIGLGAATTAPLNIPFSEITKIIDFVLLGQMSNAINILTKYVTGIKDISQLGIKRAVNVWGTNDILYQMGIAGKRDSIGGIKTYNIEIAGASHFDYMRRSDETDPVKAAFNQKVSSFIATLMTKANDDQKLLAFLQEKLVAPDSDGVWRYRP